MVANKTPGQPTTHTNAKRSAKGSNSSLQKRKRVSEAAQQDDEEDELAEDSIISSTKSRRTSLTSKSIVNSIRATNSPMFMPMDENDTPSVVVHQSISPQIQRSTPRTPLILIQSNHSASSKSTESRISNPGSSGRRNATMDTIHEDADADLDELSYESVEAIELPNGTVEEDESEIVAAIPRRSETTFVPDFEGTRDELTARVRISTGSKRRSTLVRTNARKPNHRSSAATVSAKPRPAKKKKAAKPRANAADREAVPMVGVTVYRRSKKPIADTDPLGATSIPIVNAADVLAQILGEMGNNFIAKAAEKHTKKVFETRLRYPLVSFMANVKDMIFDVSTAQNSVYALNGRLRSLKREQSELRAELIRTKKQREDTNLAIDRVRSAHTARAKEEDEETNLHNMLYDLDVAIQRGRDTTRDMTENELQFEESDVLLHDVQQLLKGGGLLESVKDWNSLLELAPARLQPV